MTIPALAPFVDDGDARIYCGDALEVLRDLPSESVHCAITSPPYWGLRDYRTGEWEGGDPSCPHTAGPRFSRRSGLRDSQSARVAVENEGKGTPFREVCGLCGARRIDQQLGLEPTPDGYVSALVDVFRELRRVLRRDGTFWLNLGDSYYSSSYSGADVTKVGGWEGSRFQKNPKKAAAHQAIRSPRFAEGLKPKDLVGIPWRVAFALQSDGWWLRSDIVWSKPNPMPESITDRPTNAHEYVFLLTRSPHYFFDRDAVREGYSALGSPRRFGGQGNLDRNDQERIYEAEDQGGRNIRDVWEIPVRQYTGSHFATFPEALPRRAILAGTSEKGCCADCGAPWERVIEAIGPDGRRGRMIRGQAYDDEGRALMGDHKIDPENRASFNSGGHILRRETIGWAPTCEHKGDPVPCVVLDPFMGTGTTAYVARNLGRHSVGIELNPESCEDCSSRLAQQRLPIEFVTPAERDEWRDEFALGLGEIDGGGE